MTAKTALLAALSLGLVLSACDDGGGELPPERVRAIKYYVVSEPAGADLRRYSASIEASDTSGLAFAVSGTVTKVLVNQGERVTAGQVIAELDPEPFDLDISAARAELASREAKLAEKQTDLDRQEKLFSQGWVARAALDQAQSAFDVAKADLDFARTRLDTAKRDRARSRLEAPFDGVIAERLVEPFEEVTAGSQLFQINSEGALQVALSVPDKVVSRINIGSPVEIELADRADCGCRGVVTEVGSASGSANAVTVRASLLEAPVGLIPGMAAEVTVRLSGGEGDRGYLVPLVALAPGDGEANSYIFRFDPGSRTVARVPVTGGTGVQGELVEIREGVSAGDIIAAAGVSFLRDGQTVKLLGE